jgi:putative endonuclease
MKATTMGEKHPAVYILASRRNGTLYTGVTSDLVKRIWEHKNNFVEGFTERHNVHMLVYYEQHATMEAAITREKQIKKWNRAWKLRLIEGANSEWRDLWKEIIC